MEVIDKLSQQISDNAKRISPDSYPVSIGEIVNMYIENEIIIKPNFQRVFRWSKKQKSQLIESIFLGLPLPSFFVATNEKREWEVVDGLQRLSTIFEFMGVLKEDAKNNINPNNSIIDGLVDTDEFKYLTQLGNIKRSDLSNELILDFKRAKLNFNILKINSDKEAKYELFQRLNTGGTQLSNQEIRSCLMIMENGNFFDFIQNIAKNEDFKNCIASISEEDLESQYDKELILRFFSLRNNTLSKTYSVEDFITKNMFNFLNQFDYDGERNIFEDTFKLLNMTLGEDVFKRYYLADQKFKRKVLLPMFDILTLWVSHNISNLNSDILRSIIMAIWEDAIINEKIGVGPSIEKKLDFALKDAQDLLDNISKGIINNR